MAAFDPATIAAFFNTIKDFFEHVWGWLEDFFSFGIGQGRQEADLIVPVQNQLMDHLGAVTDAFRVSAVPSPDLEDIIQLANAVKQYAAYFKAFVADPRFTDGRASAQALDTVMPYINGTCGYQPFVLQATVAGQSCGVRWGDGQVGGPGYDGMLGTLKRAAESMGGTIDTNIPQASTLPPITPVYTPPPYATSGFSTPMLVAIGALVIFMWSRKN